jgi:hypothetical protein
LAKQCAVKDARLQRVQLPPGNWFAPPGRSNRSGGGGAEAVGAFLSLATENDDLRLARVGAPVKQITTGTLRHLEAAMVANAFAGWRLDDFDFLFIENGGNLLWPSS